MGFTGHGTEMAKMVIISVLCCTWAISQAAATPQQQLGYSSHRRALAQAPVAPVKEKPKFESAFAALFGLPEGKLIRDIYMYTFGAMSDPNIRSKFQPVIALGTNSRAKATFFWPTDSAWTTLSKQLCLTQQQLQDTVAATPNIGLQYMQINILNGTTMMLSDFKDGMDLQTMEPGFTLPLRKRTVNGVAEWYFPGSAHGGGDVIIQRTDITAGSAVIHLVDNYITSPSQSIFWTQQAKNVGCGEVSVDTRQTASPGMIAGIAIACVVAAAALVAFIVLLVRKPPLRQRLSGGFQKGQDQQQMPPVMPQHMPPYEGPDSSRDDSCWQKAVPCDRVAVMTKTHDTTQEQMPVASKDMHAPATPHGSSTPARGSSVDDLQVGMTPVFEPNPTVSEGKMAAWLRLSQNKKALPASASRAAGSETSSSGSSGAREAAFAEQLRRELHPQLGNPNIIGNYTSFTREVEHSNTAVYFCEGMHNNRQFALKFYACQADFTAEMMAYKELGGPSSKFVPVLEMSYPGSASYPTSVLVFERGQCTLETFARQRPSYFQQIDIFHQLVSAVQHLHEHGVVHRDLKPSNVVHFPEKFAWKLIDLATIARIGEECKVVYTREYVSPEVAQALVGGAASIVAQPSWDLWGIGIIMWEMATGQRYFPPEWSMDGGRRMWSALCGFEPLPHEIIDASAIKGADRGVMKLVRRLLQRDPALRPSPQQLLSERLFQTRGVTTTQVSSGSNMSRESGGSGALTGPYPLGD